MIRDRSNALWIGYRGAAVFLDNKGHEAESLRRSLGGTHGERHHLELEQRCPGGNRVLRFGLTVTVLGVGLPVLVGKCLATSPVLKGLFALPSGHHEIAVISSHRAKQHELLESRLLIH